MRFERFALPPASILNDPLELVAACAACMHDATSFAVMTVIAIQSRLPLLIVLPIYCVLPLALFMLSLV